MRLFADHPSTSRVGVRVVVGSLAPGAVSSAVVVVIGGDVTKNCSSSANFILSQRTQHFSVCGTCPVAHDTRHPYQIFQPCSSWCSRDAEMAPLSSQQVSEIQAYCTSCAVSGHSIVYGENVCRWSSQHEYLSSQMRRPLVSSLTSTRIPSSFRGRSFTSAPWNL